MFQTTNLQHCRDETKKYRSPLGQLCLDHRNGEVRLVGQRRGSWLSELRNGGTALVGNHRKTIGKP